MTMQWLALAGGVLMLAAALYANSIAALSGEAVSLYIACLFSFKAGIAAIAPGSKTAVLGALSAVLNGFMNNPGGHANLLVYSIMLFVMASRFLSKDDNRLSGRWAGSVCAATAVFFIWHFSYLETGSASNAEALNAALFLSVFLLVSAAASGFLRKMSLLSAIAPSVLLAASMGFAWVHGVSQYAEKTYAARQSAQEEAIVSAYKLRQEQIELQRKEADAERQNAEISTVINERGEIEQRRMSRKPEQPKAIIKPVEIPRRRPLEALKSEAWRQSVREPVRRFRSEAGANGSYFLAGLLFVAGVFLSFANRLWQAELSSRTR
jgi:hypothetical protein